MFDGNTLSLIRLADGVVEMKFDAPGSVNKLDNQTLSELESATDLLEADSELQGLLMSSAKSAFIVGADITEFTKLFDGPRQGLHDAVAHVHVIFNRLEDLPVPKVAAINGFALGGGFELALTAEYRVMAESAAVGFPEVNLGIIPGYGGTVRAPRVMGCDNAIEWVCTGKHAKAKEALSLGAVDAIAAAEQLRDAAMAMLNAAIAGELDYQSRRQEKKSPVLLNDTERMMTFTSAGALVAAQAGRDYPAPMSALKAIEKHCVMDRQEAGKVEIEHFVELAFSDVASSLVGLFLADQFIAKKAKTFAKGLQPVAEASVLGAGIMGGGIAYQSAINGINVLMKDVAQAGLDTGMEEATSLLGKRVDKGRMSVKDMAATLSRIEPTLAYAGIEKSEVVVEAVIENVKIKKAVLKETEEQLAENAVLCSNTSTIRIGDLAKALDRPENFCGMHFFNPVPRMPLVEVIRAEKTSDKTVARVMSFASALGKTPILVNDCAGFLVNRVLFPYLGSANSLIREGVDFHAIDKVMEGFGWPMGPAFLQDVVGIDTCEHAAKVLAAAYPDRMRADFKSATEILYDAERFGQKNGRGFYQYVPDKKGRIRKEPDEAVVDLLGGHVSAAKTMDDETIVDRLMIPMALELVRCLDEGIVETPAEADMALIMGIGFPKFRGGICRYIDTIGLSAFCDKVMKYSDLGPQYQLLDSLRTMADNNRTFY